MTSLMGLLSFIILFIIIAAVLTAIFLLVVSITKKSRPTNDLENRVKQLEEENRILRERKS